MATATASPQPVVITIQPEFCPLDLFSSTLATTPSPRSTRIMVPINSAVNGDIVFLLGLGNDGGEISKGALLLSIEKAGKQSCELPQNQPRKTRKTQKIFPCGRVFRGFIRRRLVSRTWLHSLFPQL